AVEGFVVEHGKAAIPVDDKVDLDTGAELHGFEDAGAGEDWVGSAAAAAMPFEPGAMAVAGEIERGGHGRLGGGVDRLSWMVKSTPSRAALRPFGPKLRLPSPQGGGWGRWAWLAKRHSMRERSRPKN